MPTPEEIQKAQELLAQAGMAPGVVVESAVPSMKIKGGIKVKLNLGPVSIDTEAEPEQIVVLVKRMAQEFIAANIITKVGAPGAGFATVPQQ